MIGVAAQAQRSMAVLRAAFRFQPRAMRPAEIQPPKMEPASAAM